MKKLLTILALSALSLSAHAQATVWTESFDSSATADYTVTMGGEGLKINTTYNTTSDYFFRTSGTYFFFTGSSTTMYYGNTGDFFAAQDVDDGGWTGSANPSQLTWSGIDITGITSLSFEGMFASIATAKIDASDYCTVEYNIDGSGWNTVLDFRNDGASSNTEFLEDTDLDGIGDGTNLDSNFATFTKSIPGAGSSMDLRITVSCNSGGEDIAFDEFKILGLIAINYQPTINSFTPADGATNVSTNTDLTLTLDTAVVAGPGQIHLTNMSTSNTMDIDASSSDVSISGKVVTVTNLMLDPSTDYTVTVDSTAFQLSTGENSYGIYDNTRWNFTTMSAPLTTLNTSFDNCVASAGMASDFTIVNVEGTAKEWRCSFYGRTDSNAAYMSGYNSGAVEISDDYLISPAIQGSATTQYLHYWQKRRYTGDNMIEVLYSTDYMGDGMPQNATWMSVYSGSIADSNVWGQITNLDISAVGSDVFYIAFRYVADQSTTGAYEWNIDDIMISQDPLSISELYTTGLDAKLLGNPVVDGSIDLSLSLDKASDVQVKISNIMGQEVLSTQLSAAAGNTTQHISVDGVAPGIYLLHLMTTEGGAVIKVLVD